MQPSSQQQAQLTAVNIDDLAKEKVDEIEGSLTNGEPVTNVKLSDFTTWFSVLKQIITSADLHRTNNDRDIKLNKENPNGRIDTGESIYADYSDDNEQFTSQVDLSEQFATNSVKWTIRVKAFKLVHRLVQLVIETNHEASFTTASNVKPSPVLIKHLPDMVRLSFVAATSPYDELKIQGFEMFRVIVEQFASYEEPEFPGHSILEQYKTQFLSAVKPAFNPDAPPYITAIASQICSLWICRGLEKNVSDIKRTYQLMLHSIEKLEGQSCNQHSKLYTESELEQERVDILGSWAQLYISSRESELLEQHGRLSRLSKLECDNLNLLVQSQIESLVEKWWEAMKDYALLIMPAPKLIGTSHDNEDVYTREVALRLFLPTWPKLVLALTIWLCNGSAKEANLTKYCNFLCGIIMKELCQCLMEKSKLKSKLSQSTTLVLRSINLIVTNNQMQEVFISNLGTAQEFYRTLYHLTISHARDPNRLLLRQTLDSLYELIVKRVKKEERNVHYGLAKLISSLMSTMRDIEIAAREKSSSDLDMNRVHLSIRLKNLLWLVKSAPVFAMGEAPLQVALISVFQELIHFEPEPTVSVSSADLLKELIPVIEDETLRARFLDELFPELCDRVHKLIANLFRSDDYSDDDKLHLSHLDSLLKSMRLLIHNLKGDCLRMKIESYITSTLRVLESCDSVPDNWVSKDAKKRRELLDFLVSQNVALHRMYPELVKESEAHKILDTAIRLKKDIKDKLESRTDKQQGNLKPVTSRPQVAKIALKADFSNFYAKKS